MTRRYPGLAEIPRREAAWVGSFFVTVPLIAFVAMAASAPAPKWVWIVIAALVAIDLAIASLLLFPRTYLTLDRAAGVATFVDGDRREVIPIAEIEPLYVRRTERHPVGNSHRRITRWFTVQTAAAPVYFHRGGTEESAKRGLRRLNARLGFTRTAPDKTDYLSA